MNKNRDQFLEALVSGKHKIFGRELLPLCLSHLVALEAVNSPLVDEEGEMDAGPEDLALAIYLLSRPHRPDCLISPPPSRIPFRLKRGLQKAKQEQLEEVNLRLKAYLDDHLVGVEMFLPEGDGKRLGAPFAISLVGFLNQHTNLTHFEQWTLPVGYLIWLQASIQEQISEAEVMGDEDDALIERAKAREAKRKEASNG